MFTVLVFAFVHFFADIPPVFQTLPPEPFPTVPGGQPPSTPTPGGNPLPELLMSTPTQINFACPTSGATPVGWLTVTPNPAWMSICAPCITPEATITSVFNFTATPCPEGADCDNNSGGSGNPPPGSTVTVTPVSTTVYAFPLIYLSSSSSKSTYTDVPALQSVVCSVPVNSALPMRCDYDLGGYDNNGTVAAWVSWLVTLGDQSDPVKRYVYYKWVSSPVDIWGNLSAGLNAPVGGLSEGLKEVDNSTLISGRCLSSASGSYQGNFGCTGYILFCMDAAQCAGYGATPTPTPTSIPMSDSYCASVGNSLGGNDLGSFEGGFSDPVLLRCLSTPYMDLFYIFQESASTLDLIFGSALSELVPSVAVNPFNVCFYGYSLKLRVLGVNLPTDWIMRGLLLLGLWNAAGGVLGNSASVIGQGVRAERSEVHKSDWRSKYKDK